MNRLITFTAAALLCFSLVAAIGHASAAELKCFFPIAVKTAMSELIPQFEASSGLKVTIEYGTSGSLTGRLQKGEAADVAIMLENQVDALQNQGKIVAGSRVGIAKSGMGVFVRKGAPKPDISSVDAFKHSLMAAKLIAYTDPAGGAAGGTYMAGLLERLGIAAELKPKTKLVAAGPPLDGGYVNGDGEIGFVQISEIMAEPRVELVGPLPAAIQNYTRYAAGIVAASKQQDAGRALIAFLSSPAARALMNAKGFEPL